MISHENHPFDADLRENELWRIAWRYKLLVFVATAFGLGMGYLYSTRTRAVFEATAQILIVRKNAGLPTTSNKMKSNYEDLVSDDVLATQIMVIRSPLVVRRAIEKHQLKDLKAYADFEDPTWAIVDNLSIVKGDRSAREANVLTVSCKGSNAQECAKVLKAVIDSYRDVLKETYQNVSNETIQLFTQAKDELHQQLAVKEKTYLGFRRSAPFHWTEDEEGPNVHERRLSELEKTRSSIQLRRSEITAHVQSVEDAIARGKDPKSLLLMVQRTQGVTKQRERATLLQLKTELLALQAEEQRLLQDYGEDYPSVKSVREKIATWQTIIQNRQKLDGHDPQLDTSSKEFLPVYLDSRRQELQELKQLEVELAAAFEREQKAAQAAMIYELQDRTFRKDIGRTQRLFDQTLQGLQEMNLLKGYGGFSTQVISPVTAGRQVAPKAANILAIAGTAGLVLGLGIAYLLHAGDHSFRNAQEIHQHLGLPVLAQIPHVLRRNLSLNSAKVENGDTVAPTVYALHRPDSPEAEACRAVRTALYFDNDPGGCKVIQITSPQPGAGKSTLAANLSVSMALPGKRVLLIDADFRRPTIHRMFPLDSTVGLSTVIGGHAKGLSDGIQDGPVKNLSILPCGPTPPNPSELLTSTAFQEYLDHVRSRFDFIIIDTPPLLAVTDPSIVAKHVDGVLLVVRLGTAKRGEAFQAMETLSLSQANLQGLVVNDVSRKAGYRSFGDAYQDSVHYPTAVA